MESGKEFLVQDHCNNLMKQMQKFRQMKSYCDVILSVSERNFPSHRAILAAGSDYFDKMFSSNMKEKHAGTVVLQDVTVKALDGILGFLYTGKVSLSLESIAELLHAAHMMQITDLLEVIVNFLLDNLDQEHCLYFRDLSTMYELEEVKESVDKYLLNNFEPISRQAAFCDIVERDMAAILASDDLMVKSENMVFRALLKWVKKDPTNRRNVFPALFSLLRLQLMNQDFLCEEVRKEPLVRRFPPCIELVEDALDFHIRPEKHISQTPRKGHIFDTNAVAICCTNRLFIYNYRNETWAGIRTNESIIPSCAVASRYQSITFCGGYVANIQEACATVISFSGSSWNELPPMKSGRAGASAVFVRGELFVFGGEKRKNKRAEDFLEDFEKFDLSEETWTSVGEILTPRSFATAIVNEDLVYLMGGYVKYQSQNQPNKACTTVEIYDSLSDAWIEGTPMPQERSCFGAGLWRNNIYVVGGYGSNNAVLTSSAYMDIKDATWTTIATAIPTQMGHTRACCAGNNIVAVGGSYNGLLQFNPNSQKYATGTQTLPGITGGTLALIVWKQRSF